MNLQEIIDQARRSVHQAPTVAGCRHPKIKGWKELATTSPEKITTMAANGYSGCNWVSVAKDGFACIIDIDDVKYAKSLGMPIPWDTFVVNTPSGGLHVYLWHTEESVKLGNTNIMGPDGSPAIEFKSNNLTCASPGTERTDKEPHGYYAPANSNEIQPIKKEMVEFLRNHGRQKKQYSARASRREFHPSYELEDEIEHYDWHMTGHDKVGADGVRYIEFAVCPVDEEIHAGMDQSGNFKCCLTIGDYGLGFDCKAGKHHDLSISDVWEACEARGIEPYPYCRYLDEDKTRETKGMLSDPKFPVESTEGIDATPVGETSSPPDADANSTFTYSPDDTGNGERLVRIYGKHLRYVYETGVWMVWSSGGWKQDTNGKLMRMTKSVIAELASEAETDKALWTHAQKSASVSGRKAMIASSSVEKSVITNISEWDQDGWLYNCQNGVIDLNTQTLRKRTQNDLCIRQSPVTFDQDAICPLWEAAMDKWCCGDKRLVEYLQTAWGVTLTSDTSLQALFFCQGGGENGKDTAFSVIEYIIGSYWKNVNFMTFAESRNHSEHRNDLADLAGAVRMVTSCESSDGHSLDEGVIKQVTGCSPVTCRQIMGKPFTYIPQYKMWFMSNYEPVIKGGDWGIWRRVKKIPWNYDFGQHPEEKIPDFDRRLKAEAAGILNWMLIGLKRYIDLGHKLPYCEAVDKATEQYRTDMDIIGRFMRERMTSPEGATALGCMIYRAYVEWCKENGFFAMNSRRFYAEFRKRYPKFAENQSKNGAVFHGVALLVDGNCLIPEEVM